MNQSSQKGYQAQSRNEDDASYVAIGLAVEAQVGTEQFAVVLGDELVHGAGHCRAKAQFCQAEHSQNGAEQAIESEIGRPQEPEEQRPVQEGQQQFDSAVGGCGRHIAFGVSDKIKFHGREQSAF